MLTSLALVFLCGLLLSGVFTKLKLPGLLGMIITGVLLGPFALDLLDGSLLGISAQLRQAALVIILTRAGLSLDIDDLKRVGRPAVLMCFVPACFEIVGTVLFAPALFGITRVEAAVMGSVIAAVSPAVVVPRMLKIMDEGYGRKNSIPQLILAGASVDDVFVIVLFAAFTSLAGGESVSAASFLQIPVSIVLGVVVGVCVGLLLTLFFKRIHMRDSVKLLIILSISFLLLQLETSLKGTVPFSGLLAIMSTGLAINKKYLPLAKRLSVKYSKLWVAAEVLLFVLVGAAVDLSYAAKFGLAAVALIIFALIFRMVGVLTCLIKTKLTRKERVFCMVAYTPKATVQAAIGAVPLSMGLACGNAVLCAAVVSILITAPFGAVCIDQLYKKLLD